MLTDDDAVLQSAYETMPAADREWFWRVHDAFCAGREVGRREAQKDMAALERRVLKLELALSALMANDGVRT